LDDGFGQNSQEAGSLLPHIFQIGVRCLFFKKEAEEARQREIVAGQTGRNIQVDAFALLKAIERATRGSSAPVVLEQLRDLQMTEGEAQTAFHYLKSRGLIEANFGIFYSARMSPTGHDAIKEAESTPMRQEPPAAPAPEGKSAELLTLKPGIWGVNIDLKEAALGCGGA
jgi:hypothetical protein